MDNEYDVFISYSRKDSELVLGIANKLTECENDSQDFVQKLSEMTGLCFRLPTEAEWEYAARGGKRSKRNKYNEGNILNQVGWYNENSGGVSHEVGKKSPNELDIYDMSGNIWEWVQNWKGDYTKDDQINPKGPETGLERVCRADDQATLSYCSLGLRLVMEKRRL